MGCVIQFPRKANVSEAMRLKEVSDALDRTILDAIQEKKMDPYEIAGLLSHRLGSLMRGFSHKDDLWEICQKVVKRQAVL
jgi:hypothetical protein